MSGSFSLSFPPCWSPLYALISSHTCYQGKSPDCSSMFFMFTSNSHGAAEFNRKSKISTYFDCVGEEELKLPSYSFLVPTNLFTEAVIHWFSIWGGQKPHLFLRTVHSHLSGLFKNIYLFKLQEACLDLQKSHTSHHQLQTRSDVTERKDMFVSVQTLKLMQSTRMQLKIQTF